MNACQVNNVFIVYSLVKKDLRWVIREDQYFLILLKKDKIPAGLAKDIKIAMCALLRLLSK
jgi:hypothetical protein